MYRVLTPTAAAPQVESSGRLAVAPAGRDGGFAAAGPNNFDAIRLLLAALVIVSHGFALGQGTEANEPLFRLFRNTIFDHPTTLGAWAVDGFFIASGFLIAMSWERRGSTWDYFLRRVRRVYPGFIVAVLIGAYVVPYLAIASGNWSHLPVGSTLAHSLRLLPVSHPDAFASNAYAHATNGSLWSIAFEFWCYVGVALLGLTGLLSRRWVVTALFAVSLVVAVGMSATTWRPGGGILGEVVGYPLFWARLLPFYLAGVVVYRWRDRLRFSNAGMRAATVLLVISGFIPHAWAALLPLTLTYALFWLAYHPSIPKLAVTRWGDWSYGTYLYGFPIQQLCVMAAGGAMAPVALIAISLPLSLLAGLASWMLVERWCVQRHGREGVRPGQMPGERPPSLPPSVPPYAKAA